MWSDPLSVWNFSFQLPPNSWCQQRQCLCSITPITPLPGMLFLTSLPDSVSLWIRLEVQDFQEVCGFLPREVLCFLYCFHNILRTWHHWEMKTWKVRRKSFPGQKNSLCKGPVLGVSMAHATKWQMWLEWRGWEETEWYKWRLEIRVRAKSCSTVVNNREIRLYLKINGKMWLYFEKSEGS